MVVKRLPYKDPLKTFLSLHAAGYPVTMFLDSGTVNKKTERFSFICIGTEDEIILRDDPYLFEKLDNFYTRYSNQYRIEDIPFGIYGYLSYDSNRFIENIPTSPVDDLKIPDIHFFIPHQTLIFDNIKKIVYLISFEKDLDIENLPWYNSSNYASVFHRTNMTKDYFIQSIRKIKEYIASGDSFQVNFSQRIDVLFEGDHVELYRKLRNLNPSPFSFFFQLGNFTAVSCSPERLVRVEGKSVETRPIAGTRRRGKDEKEDRKLEEELFLSEKERAEHIMLVDLERNDLGKICRYGTVEVDELMVPEYYSHVIHIVSNVRGILKDGTKPVDVLKALFPGGTITGAPKVRTMEIIAELEPTRRGLYTGSVGYIAFNGNMDFNIVIRTLIFKQENLGTLQVGAGIVWDSDPEKEFEETLHKGRVLLESLGVNF